MRAIETTSSYTYTVDTFREANASPVNRLNWFHPLGGGMVQVNAINECSNTVGNAIMYCALGLDSTSVTVTSGCSLAHIPPASAGLLQTPGAFFYGTAGQGRHFMSRLERSNVVGTTNWFGNVAAGGLGSCIHGTIWN